MVQYLIFSILIVLIFLFVRDRFKDKEQIAAKGGINVLYPNFVAYIESFNEMVRRANDEQAANNPNWEFVEQTDRKLEYRIAWIEEDRLTGFFYYSVRHDFQGRVEGYFISENGDKFEGSLVQFDRNKSEPSLFDYTKYYGVIGGGIYNSAQYQQYLKNLLQ